MRWHYRVRICPATGKQIYTEAHARAWAAELCREERFAPKGAVVQAYPCDRCGGWHVGHPERLEQLVELVCEALRRV